MKINLMPFYYDEDENIEVGEIAIKLEYFFK